MIPKRNNAIRISQLSLSADKEAEPKEEIPDSTSTVNSQEVESPVIPSSQDQSFTPVIQEPEAANMYHHPQIIDQDVENFTTRLDSMIGNFRNETIKEFLSVKRQILHEQITTIESERKRCNALMGSKQDELEHLKEQLAESQKLNNTYTNQKEALANRTGNLKNQKYNTELATKAYLSWLHYHQFSQMKKRMLKVTKAMGRRHVMNEIFSAWKEKWTEYHHLKTQRALEDRINAEKQELANLYNKEIELLTARLNQAEAKINEEEEAKKNIQDNLKKAFMRGVCALNFEAMNILNPATNFIDNVALGFEEPTQKIETQIVEPAIVKTPEKDLLDEIQNIIPPDSKQTNWKPAPVFGRPQTAPAAKLNNPLPEILPPSITQLSSLPSNLDAPSQGVGKTIVVNNANNPEIRVKGKVPNKPIVGKKLK
ncbi:unnamed protein product [Blepharisma stoltei]|uniref:Centrosomal protein POC5 n=1 Tax=Blepharisma stoltei TaxID=1481888 RepID=A0AAU9JVM7_9CILI|nr:unnamed protein product [Blepharisma stoltei]